MVCETVCMRWSMSMRVRTGSLMMTTNRICICSGGGTRRASLEGISKSPVLGVPSRKRALSAAATAASPSSTRSGGAVATSSLSLSTRAPTAGNAVTDDMTLAKASMAHASALQRRMLQRFAKGIENRTKFLFTHHNPHFIQLFWVLRKSTTHTFFLHINSTVYIKIFGRTSAGHQDTRTLLQCCSIRSSSVS